MTNSLLYDLMNQMYIYSESQESPRDEIFESEGKVIRELAAKGNCVIVGRCADYILRSRPNTLKVFLHAPEPFRVQRIMKTEHLSKEEALQKVRQTDRRRSDNYRYYTRRIWGRAQNYDLTLNTEAGTDIIQNFIIEMTKVYPLHISQSEQS